MKLERCTPPQIWEACRSYGAANVQRLRGTGQVEMGDEIMLFLWSESFGWLVWMVRRWSQNLGWLQTDILEKFSWIAKRSGWVATSRINSYALPHNEQWKFLVGEQCEVWKTTGITVGCLSFCWPCATFPGVQDQETHWDNSFSTIANDMLWWNGHLLCSMSKGEQIGSLNSTYETDSSSVTWQICWRWKVFNGATCKLKMTPNILQPELLGLQMSRKGLWSPGREETYVLTPCTS